MSYKDLFRISFGVIAGGAKMMSLLKFRVGPSCLKHVNLTSSLRGELVKCFMTL